MPTLTRFICSLCSFAVPVCLAGVIHDDPADRTTVEVATIQTVTDTLRLAGAADHAAKDEAQAEAGSGRD